MDNTGHTTCVKSFKSYGNKMFTASEKRFGIQNTCK